MQKLDVKGLALALGLTWGGCTLICGWISMFGWGTKFVDLMSSFYIGYSASIRGGIIGGIWGFFDAAIGGMFIALLYNVFARKNAVK